MSKKQGHKISGTRSEEEIKKELYQIADLAYERMMKIARVQENGHYADFTEREDLAESIGKEFGECFLEAGLIKDKKYQEIMKSDMLPCPKCKKLIPRAKDKDGKLLTEEIMVKTKVGEIPFEGPLFRCATCRRNFSPLKNHLKIKHRTLQSILTKED